MKVYVIGKFEDTDRIHQVQQILIDGCHTISHDWTPLSIGLRKTLNEKRCESVADTRGVIDAALVVGVFVENLDYVASFAEEGMAIVTNKPVILIGQYAKRNVFSYHPLVVAWFTSIEEFGRHRVYKYGGEVKIKEIE